MTIQDNLLDYLIENSNEETSRYLEWMKHEISGHVYYFGEHFKCPKETTTPKNTLRLQDYAEILAIRLLKKKSKQNGKKILSSAYASWNNHIENLGYDVHRPPWNLRRDFKIECSIELYLLTKEIRRCFNTSDFSYFTSKKFLSLLKKHHKLFKEFCISNSYEALIVPDDVGYFGRLAISVFKELGKPSFHFAHGGMPSHYDRKFDNRTDFSVQWGQKQVDAYVKMGFDPSKMLICGSPEYNKSPENLRFGLDQILVLTKSLNGVCPLEKPHLEDRGNAIIYLNSIQKVLQKLGIKNVRLRPHPSENYNWYKKFIDNSFFSKCEPDLSTAMNKSTLVIGPTSNVFIDSLYHGVNYVVYEPMVNNYTLMGFPITPPLDGLDKRIPFAQSETDLEMIITEKRKVNTEVYKEFVKTPRDINFLKDLI